RRARSRSGRIGHRPAGPGSPHRVLRRGQLRHRRRRCAAQVLPLRPAGRSLFRQPRPGHGRFAAGPRRRTDRHLAFRPFARAARSGRTGAGQRLPHHRHHRLRHAPGRGGHAAPARRHPGRHRALQPHDLAAGAPGDHRRAGPGRGPAARRPGQPGTRENQEKPDRQAPAVTPEHRMDSSITPLSLPSIGPTLAALRPGQRYALPRPPGSGDALLLATLAREARHTLAAFCADPLAARRLADEIALFDPDLRVRFLPDWETLPYDGFSPHQDLISERLRTLHALSQDAVDILVVPVTTALVRLAPPAFLAAYTFHFRQGDTLDEDRLRTQLTLANYSHVTQVGAPGEFCIRGGLIDLF